LSVETELRLNAVNALRRLVQENNVAKPVIKGIKMYAKCIERYNAHVVYFTKYVRYSAQYI